MKGVRKLFAMASLIAFGGVAQATVITETSPILGGTNVASGVTAVGGIVFDAVGTNGTRVTSQLAASSLFVGFYNTGTPTAYQGNPGTIGIQSGFDTSVTNQLGGGFNEVAIRITLFDGDTAAGNFDYNDNTLLLNSINFGNWSTVTTDNTNSIGTISNSTSTGFRNDLLDTGWFYSNDATTLSNLWTSIVSSESITFTLNDTDPYDNFFDFTQGVDGGLINTGQGPTTGGQVPVPATLALFGLGLLGLGWQRNHADKDS